MKPRRQNASIIAKRDGKFLLVRKPRDRHAWQFPQGGVEPNESFAEAAIREFAEEVGIHLQEVSEEVGTYFYDWPEDAELNDELKNFRGQEVHFFTTELPTNTEVLLDEKEIIEHRFVDVAELRRLVESPDYLDKILEIIDAQN